jgi:hypothetical protein
MSDNEFQRDKNRNTTTGRKVSSDEPVPEILETKPSDTSKDSESIKDYEPKVKPRLAVSHSLGKLLLTI